VRHHDGPFFFKKRKNNPRTHVPHGDGKKTLAYFSAMNPTVADTADFLTWLRATRRPEGVTRFRLAPTPSGFLHVGNALNFVLNALGVRLSGPYARLLLRIDDLDADRMRPEYLTDVFETLEWLGIEWHEGPEGPDDFERNWSQHTRKSLYFNTLQILRDLDAVYACGLSRRQLAELGEVPTTQLRSRQHSLDEPDVAWRMRTPDGLALSDFVVRRRDGLPAYQVASLCDDRHFGVTHLVRGADLRPSTEAQRWLARQLGWPADTDWAVWHHPLVADASGAKLSKSAGADALRTRRTSGDSPRFIFQLAAKWLHAPDPTIENLNDLAAQLA
jgi:glutamyl-tRNA synthetase